MKAKAWEVTIESFEVAHTKPQQWGWEIRRDGHPCMNVWSDNEHLHSNNEEALDEARRVMKRLGLAERKAKAGKE